MRPFVLCILEHDIICMKIYWCARFVAVCILFGEGVPVIHVLLNFHNWFNSFIKWVSARPFFASVLRVLPFVAALLTQGAQPRAVATQRALHSCFGIPVQRVDRWKKGSHLHTVPAGPVGGPRWVDSGGQARRKSGPRLHDVPVGPVGGPRRGPNWGPTGDQITGTAPDGMGKPSRTPYRYRC